MYRERRMLRLVLTLYSSLSVIEVIAASSAGTSALYGVASAIGSLVLLAGLKWTKDQVLKNLNEGRAENAATLARIEKQVGETNGDVLKLKEAEAIVRERLGKNEGRVDTISQLLTGLIQPPKS